MTIKRFLLSIFVISVLLLPVHVHAEDTIMSDSQQQLADSLTQSSTIDQTEPEITPIPDQVPNQGYSSIETEQSSTSYSDQTATLSHDPIVTENTEDAGSDTQTGENTDIVHETNATTINDTTIVNDISGQVTTGQNAAEENIVSTNTVITGDADTAVVLDNQVNTNIISNAYATNALSIEKQSDQTIDLSSLSFQCLAPSANLLALLESQHLTFKEFINLINTNNANILNTIHIQAITGQNIASGFNTDITTGDASVDIDIANIGNTNLVGNCFYFAIINIFADQNGDIILPYEFAFLDQNGFIPSIIPVHAESYTVESTSSIDSTNTADIDTTIDANLDTGNNDGGGTTKTGSGVLDVQGIDILNRNFTGNNWIYLDINTFGNWTGSILNWLMGYNPIGVQAADQSTDLKDQTIDIEHLSSILTSNTATVKNDIHADLITGQNMVTTLPTFSSNITTGDASMFVKLLNILNTNIIGNNWYYAMINVFGDFHGNIIFPRPDLYVSGALATPKLSSGEYMDIFINFGNKGILWAKDTKLSIQVPSMFSIAQAWDGGMIQGNTVLWDLGQLEKNTSGKTRIRVQLHPDFNENYTAHFPIHILTSTIDIYESNNAASLALQVTHTAHDSGSTASSQIASTSTSSTDTSLSESKVIKTTEKVLSAFTGERDRILDGISTDVYADDITSLFEQPNEKVVTPSIQPNRASLLDLWLLLVLSGVLLAQMKLQKKI